MTLECVLSSLLLAPKVAVAAEESDAMAREVRLVADYNP